MLNGEDPVAYILSANVNRRHLSKGQRAMAAVVAGLNTKYSTRDVGEIVQTSQGYTSRAAVVHEHAKDLVGQVMAGTLALNDAYEQAKRRKEEAESAEERAERDRNRLAAIQVDAPDLAELVAEGRMKLGEAWTVLQERIRDRREADERTVAYFENAVTMLWSILHLDPEEVVERWIDGRIQKMTVEPLRHLQTGDGLRELARLIEACAEGVDRRGGLA